MEQYILQTFGKKKPDQMSKILSSEKKVSPRYLRSAYLKRQ